MTMTEYLKHPAINSSKLKRVLETPLDYKESCEEENDETKSTILGSAIHTLLLEPAQFADRYALETEDYGNKTAGDGKKRWDAFKKENSAKVILNREQTLFIHKLQPKIRKNAHLKLVLASGDAEVTGIIEEGPISLKARADLLTQSTIWDVKTSRDGMDDVSLYKTVKKYMYDFQLAHYLHVFNLICPGRFKSCGWIFVDTSGPAQHIRLIKCPENLLKNAISRHQNALNIVKECTEMSWWNGYPQHITELQLPVWAEELRQWS